MSVRHVWSGLLIVWLVACATPAPSPAPSGSVTVSPVPSVAPRAPVIGQSFGLVYDPVQATVVLVNGIGEQDPPRSTELWAWDGSAWTLFDAVGPRARSFAAIGRDPLRHDVIVHGGGDATGVFDETLVYDGRAWTTHETPGPGAREGAGLAWYANGRQMILFGGAIDGVQQTDTWAWDGETWARVATDGPPGRFISLLSAEPGGGVLLHGGHAVGPGVDAFLGDTWLWRDGTWMDVSESTGPGPRVNSPGVVDGRQGEVAMFGGGVGRDEAFATDTWLWADGWRLVETPINHPSPRNGHGLVYDETRQVLVLVGGIDRPGGEQRLDVWELGANGWRQAWSAG